MDRFETRDGARLSVRQIEPADKAALAAAFGHLSDESVYRRFLAPLTRLTGSELAYLTELDHSDHEALVAVTDPGEIVGVARYVRDPAEPDRAEAAVTVTDGWQGRGVGSCLLGLLASRARENGIDHFTGILLADNHEMLSLFEELGRTTTRREAGSGTIEVEVELPTGSPWEIRPALRAAARAHRSRAT